MRILNELGGIELASAYTCIKAIRKKKEEIIAKNREQFVKGCVANGLTEQQAIDFWTMIIKFAGYGFNKSHSTAYALIAYMEWVPPLWGSGYHDIQQALNLLAPHRGKLLKKPVERIARLQVVEEGLDRDACPGEARHAVHDLWVTRDERFHASILPRSQPLARRSYPG